MNVKILLNSQKEARSSTRDLIRKIKCLHYSTAPQKINAVTLQWRLQKLSVWVLNILFLLLHSQHLFQSFKYEGSP